MLKICRHHLSILSMLWRSHQHRDNSVLALPTTIVPFTCRYKDVACNNCKKIGHIQRVCRTKNRELHGRGRSIPKRTHQVSDRMDTVTTLPTTPDDTSYNLVGTRKRSDPFMTEQICRWKSIREPTFHWSVSRCTASCAVELSHTFYQLMFRYKLTLSGEESRLPWSTHSKHNSTSWLLLAYAWAWLDEKMDWDSTMSVHKWMTYSPCSNLQGWGWPY